MCKPHYSNAIYAVNTYIHVVLHTVYVYIYFTYMYIHILYINLYNNITIITHKYIYIYVVIYTPSKISF